VPVVETAVHELKLGLGGRQAQERESGAEVAEAGVVGSGVIVRE
jgi:hypothetical protein